MIFRAEATVAQSREAVWAEVVDVSTWKSWYGGELVKVVPGWQVGAEVEWTLGPPSTVTAFVPFRNITFRSESGTISTFNFSGEAEGGVTNMVYSEDYSQSQLSVIDPRARQAQCDETIQGLRFHLEGLGPSDEADDQFANGVERAPVGQFVALYCAVLKRFADSNGRSDRREFWTFQVVNLLIFFAFGILDTATGLANPGGVTGGLGACCE